VNTGFSSRGNTSCGYGKRESVQWLGGDGEY
jgi:hypothetical protein